MKDKHIDYKGKKYTVKSRKVIWNTHKDSQLRVMRESGRSVDAMAKHFHCSKNGIWRRLKVLNLTDDKWTAIQDSILLSQRGKKSYRELARLVGKNQQYVKDRIAYLDTDK